MLVPNTITKLSDYLESVVIGSQRWTSKNLDVTTYRNGDIIPEVNDPAEWSSLTTGAWCYYANDSANGTTYGKLYNWYAVNDPRGLAPTGWHVASDAEWTILTDYLGGALIAGGAMKETGTTHWSSPNVDANNTSNFTGLPGGVRSSAGGIFSVINNYGTWWSSTDNFGLPWTRVLYYNSGETLLGSDYYTTGLSVRLIKDNEFHPLIKGNIALGVEGRGYGETQRTGYWNGKGIPNWGYIIYQNRLSEGFSAYSVRNDAEMIAFSNSLLSESFSTIYDALSAFSENDDVLIANINYPDIIARNLVYHIDAGFVPSYPKGGDYIYDLSGNGLYTIVDRNLLYPCLSIDPSYSQDFGGILNLPNSSGRWASFPGFGRTLNNFTVNCIFKLSRSGDAFIFGQKPNQNPSVDGYGFNFQLSYTASSDGFYAYFMDSLGQLINVTYQPGGSIDFNSKWWDVAFSFDGNYLRLYIDGVFYDNLYTETSPISNGNPFIIGNDYQDDCDSYRPIQVMSIKVYDSVLSDAEILQNYNAMKGRTSPNIYSANLIFDTTNPDSYPGDGSWHDVSGNGWNATLTNTLYFPSKFPETLIFNGADSYGIIPTTYFNKNDGDPLTLSVWIKPERNGIWYQNIVANRDDNGVYNWMLYQHGDDGAISFHGNSQNKGTHIPILKKWINVTVTVTAAGVCTIYIDGAIQNIFNGYTYHPDVSGSLQFGIARPGSTWTFNEAFKGYISAVSIYSNALTDDDVFYLYDSTRGYYQAIPEEIPILGTGYTLQNGNYGYIQFSTSEPNGESQIYVDWGDGNSELIQSEGGNSYYAEHNYDYSYDWDVRISAVDLGVIQDIFMSYIDASSYIGLDALTGCTSIDISGTLITNLDFELPPNLNILYANDCNSLTEFNPFYALPDSITQIYFQNCINLSSLNPLQLPESLESLILYGCALTSFTYDLQGYTNLLAISLYGNNITSFTDFVIFPNSIRNINLGDNGMSSVDLINMPDGLLGLYLDYNPGISISHLNNLPSGIQSINLFGTGISDFPTSALRDSLCNIDLRNNYLSSSVVNSILLKIVDRGDPTYPFSPALYIQGQDPPAPPTGDGIAALIELVDNKDWHIEAD